MKIKIVQIGDIEPNVADLITKDLNKRFRSKFYLGGKMKLPEDSFDKFKRQYNAETVVKFLKTSKGADDKIIGITSNDLFTKDLNFVFGLSGNDACVVSTARLDPQFYGNSADFELLIDRASKEIIHEVGHMFGIKHCKNPECVMSASSSISYVDDKKDDFCKECSMRISMEDIKI